MIQDKMINFLTSTRPCKPFLTEEYWTPVYGNGPGSLNLVKVKRKLTKIEWLKIHARNK